MPAPTHERAPDSFQVFISHGRVKGEFQPQVIDLITAIGAVPHLRPRADTYPDEGISFIEQGDDWRTRIEVLLQTADAAVVCLDRASAGSDWVIHEAEQLWARARVSPEFRVFYLADDEAITRRDEAPWSRWGPLRPLDTQLSRWDDLDALVQCLARLPNPDRPHPALSTFTNELAAVLDDDPGLRKNVVRVLAARGDASSDIWARVRDEPGMVLERLHSKWIATGFASYLLRRRTAGQALDAIDPGLDVVMSALSRAPRGADCRRRTLNALMPLLPADSEVDVVRRSFNPGPSPDEHYKGIVAARQSDSVPMILDRPEDEQSGWALDVRPAILGRSPKPPVLDSEASDREWDIDYLREVFAAALGIEAPESERRRQVPILDAGEIGLEGRPEGLGGLLHDASRSGSSKTTGGAAVRSPETSLAEHRLCSAIPDQEVRPTCVVVGCQSYRAVRRLWTSIGQEHGCLPQVSVVFEVRTNRGEDRRALKALPGDALRLLDLDRDRVRTRVRDREWLATQEWE